MKSLTSASAVGLPLGTQTAVLELRNASSRMREPGLPSRTRICARAQSHRSCLAQGCNSSIDTGEINVSRSRSGFPGCAKGCRICNAADADARRVGIFHRPYFRAGGDKKGTLQQMICITEVDEFLALFIDRRKATSQRLADAEFCISPEA